MQYERGRVMEAALGLLLPRITSFFSLTLGWAFTYIHTSYIHTLHLLLLSNLHHCSLSLPTAAAHCQLAHCLSSSPFAYGASLSSSAVCPVALLPFGRRDGETPEAVPSSPVCMPVAASFKCACRPHARPSTLCHSLFPIPRATLTEKLPHSVQKKINRENGLDCAVSWLNRLLLSPSPLLPSLLPFLPALSLVSPSLALDLGRTACTS
ncbi:hypothetical protein EV426DRAFT_103342 [Tirmania nivea]|nr:hypothetical protein EV426DRAFT_103342 [Tirmania nivea]